MASGSKKKRELLERVIDLSKSVDQRKVDPFEVDVPDFLERLRELFSETEDTEELMMDIQAVLGLTDVVSQQEKWIKQKSSLLNFDPMMVAWKVRELSEKQLAYVLLNSLHQTMELEGISEPGVREAIEYWENLEPLSERGTELETEEVFPEEVSREELEEFGFESREDFDELVEETWEELKEISDENNEIPYWDFIDSENFRETILNAWLVSFLISYGYAMIEMDPLEEEITLKAREERETPADKSGTSVPISITYEEWKNRREGNG